MLTTTVVTRMRMQPLWNVTCSLPRIFLRIYTIFSTLSVFHVPKLRKFSNVSDISLYLYNTRDLSELRMIVFLYLYTNASNTNLSSKIVKARLRQ